MNRVNDWKNVLKYANKDVNPKGYTIKVFKDAGYYSCVIVDKNNGNEEIDYAGGFCEEELSNLITDAWHYVLSLK